MLAALVVVAVALLLGYARHVLPQRSTVLASADCHCRLCHSRHRAFGGAVFIPVAWLDNQLIALTGLRQAAVLKGSVGVVAGAGLPLSLGGFVARGWCISAITASRIMAARSLGDMDSLCYSGFIASAARRSHQLLLVVIDVLKEMRSP
ncbi:MAG: hypothetical protein IPN27_07470 [Cellvibrionales bacterium]|nr:hypothetical protein [Cellvibrionales bacterium]